MTALLDPQDWTFPVPIAYGPGRLREIGDICRAAGMVRPLIVTDRGSAGLAFMDDLRGHLDRAGMTHATFSGVSANPRDAEIGAGAALYRDGGHDGVIAIGGGSGMDGGKAVALTATSGLDLWAFEFERPAPDMSARAPFPPLVCIPTTAGTGAETESTAMITDVARGMKLCIWHADLKPACALLDPDLTLGLPGDLTAWTGLDALVHAIEAYSVPGFHPFCDGAALEALRLITRWLPVVCEEPDNTEARGGMLVGSCLAGVAFMKGLGLVHAISHMVGAEYDTHHGLTNAVVLPQVLRFNAPALADRTEPMAQAMGLVTGPVTGPVTGQVTGQVTERAGTGIEDIYAHVVALLDALGIPRNLADLGVTQEASARLAAKAAQDSAAATNPRAASVDEIAALIDRTVRQGR